jgi:aryl-alcohol dehydrogenase-like predicted oxidoreductase
MMEYRPLGSSGVSVSTLALGTMTFGTETDEEAAHVQLDRFVEMGGNLVDTADVYSHGVSEQIIGRWLAKRPPDIRDQVVLATKGRFATGAGPNEVGLSRRHLVRALDASLARLGVDTLDLYQVHAWDPYTPVEETLTFLDAAVRAGKIHYVGLSNFTGWQIQKAVDVADARDLVRPITLQPQYNLLAREVEWEIVPACQSEGLGVLPWSPLGGGWLTGKYRRDQRPTGATRLGENPNRGVEAYDRRRADERTWNVLGAVEEIAGRRGLSMAQVALAWLVDQPTVCSVILGARTQAQLTDNLGAAGVHLSDDELRRLDLASDPSPADYPYGAPGVEQRSRQIAGEI